MVGASNCMCDCRRLEVRELFIENQVYQGTVLGPILWDVNFEDVHVPIRNSGFKEVTFADDLNSYKGYDGTVANSVIRRHCKKCQTEVH